MQSFIHATPILTQQQCIFSATSRSSPVAIFFSSSRISSCWANTPSSHLPTCFRLSQYKCDSRARLHTRSTLYHRPSSAEHSQAASIILSSRHFAALPCISFLKHVLRFGRTSRIVICARITSSFHRRSVLASMWVLSNRSCTVSL